MRVRAHTEQPAGPADPVGCSFRGPGYEGPGEVRVGGCEGPAEEPVSGCGRPG